MDSVDGWLCAVARPAGAERPCQGLPAVPSRTPIRQPRRWSIRWERVELFPSDYHPLCDPWDEIHRRDLSRVLHGALGQLPEKYKAAIELCYLEGKTNEEAARQLGWPAGSMSRRLKRARSLLRLRLVRMGLMLAVCLACAAYAFAADHGRMADSRRGSRGFRSPGDAVVSLVRRKIRSTWNRCSSESPGAARLPSRANNSRLFPVQPDGLPRRRRGRLPVDVPQLWLVAGREDASGLTRPR